MPSDPEGATIERYPEQDSEAMQRNRTMIQRTNKE